MVRPEAFFAVFLHVVLVSSKIIPIIDEKLEFCLQPDETAKMDYSQLEIVVVSDTETYLNGTIVIKEEIRSPFVGYIYTEKFDRGQWNIEAMYKKIADFCNEMQNPLMPWYKYTSKMDPKNCPFPPGVRSKFYLKPSD